MKPLLIIYFTYLLSTTNALAQSFSLTELLKLKTLSYPEFETVVNRKGYHYTNYTNDDFAKMYEFGYNESNGYATKRVICDL